MHNAAQIPGESKVSTMYFDYVGWLQEELRVIDSR